MATEEQGRWRGVEKEKKKQAEWKRGNGEILPAAELQKMEKKRGKKKRWLKARKKEKVPTWGKTSKMYFWYAHADLYERQQVTDAIFQCFSISVCPLHLTSQTIYQRTNFLNGKTLNPRQMHCFFFFQQLNMHFHGPIFNLPTLFGIFEYRWCCLTF